MKLMSFKRETRPQINRNSKNEDVHNHPAVQLANPVENDDSQKVWLTHSLVICINNGEIGRNFSVVEKMKRSFLWDKANKSSLSHLLKWEK